MNNLLNIYWWKNRYCDLKTWFNPRQKWLIKKIPNRWMDCDALIQLCIFESFKHFVEKEEGLESIWGERYAGESEDWRLIREPVRKELEEIYEYIKSGRDLLQKELDESYPEPINGGNLLDHLDPVVEEGGQEVKTYKMRTCEEIYGKSYQEAYAEVHRLEELIEKRDTWAMTGIIKYRVYLWT